MRLYPDPPMQRTAAFVGDLAVLALLGLFAWLAVEVHDAVDKLAVLGDGVEQAGTSVAGGLEAAADAVDGTPLVGGELADGLRAAGEGTGGEVAEAGREGEERAHDLANLLGALTFVVPSVLLLAQALPARVERVRRLTAANRALGADASADGGERTRLVAMRAAFSLPYDQLLRYTRDPLGDLAAGRYDALVRAAYEDAGLQPRRS
jgi:hypothetical protein